MKALVDKFERRMKLMGFIGLAGAVFFAFSYAVAETSGFTQSMLAVAGVGSVLALVMLAVGRLSSLYAVGIASICFFIDELIHSVLHGVIKDFPLVLFTLVFGCSMMVLRRYGGLFQKGSESGDDAV